MPIPPRQTVAHGVVPHGHNSCNLSRLYQAVVRVNCQHQPWHRSWQRNLRKSLRSSWGIAGAPLSMQHRGRRKIRTHCACRWLHVIDTSLSEGQKGTSPSTNITGTLETRQPRHVGTCEHLQTSAQRSQMSGPRLGHEDNEHAAHEE